jgi:hypothetical protein
LKGEIKKKQKKPESNLTNMLNSLPEIWYRDNFIEIKGKEIKKYQFPTSLTMMNEILKIKIKMTKVNLVQP